MNAPTLIVLAIVLVLVVFAIVFMRKNKAKNGCSSYKDNSCSGCDKVDCPLKNKGIRKKFN